MELSRRDFLKLSGVGTGGFFLYSVLEQDKALASPKQLPLKKKIGEKTTICPYCGVGCSAIMAVENSKIINIEGDPDSWKKVGSTVHENLTMEDGKSYAFAMMTVDGKGMLYGNLHDGEKWSEAETELAGLEHRKCLTLLPQHMAIEIRLWLLD